MVCTATGGPPSPPFPQAAIKGSAKGVRSSLNKHGCEQPSGLAFLGHTGWQVLPFSERGRGPAGRMVSVEGTLSLGNSDKSRLECWSPQAERTKQEASLGCESPRGRKLGEDAPLSGARCAGYRA